MPRQGVNANNLLLNFLQRFTFVSAGAEQYVYSLAAPFADCYKGKIIASI